MLNTIFNISPYPLKVLFCSIVGYYKSNQKYGRHFFDCLNFLLNSDLQIKQSKANDELYKFLKKMKANSNFYRNLIPDTLDINLVPIINKNIVLNNYKKIILEKPYKMGSSSGTTGTPLRVPYSKYVYQREFAFWWYHWGLAGIKQGDKIATIAGHKVTEVSRNKPPFWLYNLADNQLFFSSYHLSPANIPYYIMKLNSFKPDFIFGYPSSIFTLSKYILENGTPIYFKPKMILTSSEKTYSFQRRSIEAAFKTKLYIMYGNAEYCGHIVECAFGKLHVQPNHSYVRIVKNNGEEAKYGESGFLVATNFSNYSFPLINYNTLDIVKLSNDQNCKCHYGGIIIDTIEGRNEDFIITPEKRIIYRLGHIFKNAENIRNAQIEQTHIDSITLRIERQPLYSTKNEDLIRSEAKSRLGDSIGLHFEYVDEIQKNENGKFKFLIQRMSKTDLEKL